MPAGFTTTVLPRNERGTDLVAKQRYGEIPRHDRTAHTDRSLDDHAVPLLVELPARSRRGCSCSSLHSVRACARSGESPAWLPRIGLPCSCVSKRASSFSRSLNRPAALNRMSARCGGATSGPFLESAHGCVDRIIDILSASRRRRDRQPHRSPDSGFRLPRRPKRLVVHLQ